MPNGSPTAFGRGRALGTSLRFLGLRHAPTLRISVPNERGIFRAGTIHGTRWNAIAGTGRPYPYYPRSLAGRARYGARVTTCVGVQFWPGPILSPAAGPTFTWKRRMRGRFGRCPHEFARQFAYAARAFARSISALTWSYTRSAWRISATRMPLRARPEPRPVAGVERMIVPIP